MIEIGSAARPTTAGWTGRAFEAVPAPALVLLGIVSVQLGAALAKGLFGAVGSLGAVALRILFAAAVLLLVWRPSLRMERSAWAIVLGYGLIIGTMNVSFYLALARIPLGMAVTISFLGPIAVALAGSRRWLDVLWAVLAATGIVLLMEGGGAFDAVGIALAVVTGVMWGLYILAGAALGRTTAQGNGLAVGMAVAALVVVPIGVTQAGGALLEPWVLAAGAGVSLLSSVIPYSVELEALRRIPPRVFGILMSLEPAVAAVVGLVLLGEALHPLQWIAVLCVVAASAGATRGSRTAEA